METVTIKLRNNSGRGRRRTESVIGGDKNGQLIVLGVSLMYLRLLNVPPFYEKKH
jgi:hypothetical protein